MKQDRKQTNEANPRFGTCDIEEIQVTPQISTSHCQKSKLMDKTQTNEANPRIDDCC